MASFHIAQLNIARALAPLDTPQMADFMNGLARINALAEESPGFVWRLQDDVGDATSIRPFDDDRIIVNMSVWESVDALFQYAYYSTHVEFFRRRAEWFDKAAEAMVVLWWIPAGHLPDVEEAKQKLFHLRAHGPTPHAFTFRQRFDPPHDANG
jgi:hypothetical protein